MNAPVRRRTALAVLLLATALPLGADEPRLVIDSRSEERRVGKECH